MVPFGPRFDRRTSWRPLAAEMFTAKACAARATSALGFSVLIADMLEQKACLSRDCWREAKRCKITPPCKSGHYMHGARSLRQRSANKQLQTWKKKEEQWCVSWSETETTESWMLASNKTHMTRPILYIHVYYIKQERTGRLSVGLEILRSTRKQVFLLFFPVKSWLRNNN